LFCAQCQHIVTVSLLFRRNACRSFVAAGTVMPVDNDMLRIIQYGVADRERDDNSADGDGAATASSTATDSTSVCELGNANLYWLLIYQVHCPILPHKQR